MNHTYSKPQLKSYKAKCGSYRRPQGSLRLRYRITTTNISHLLDNYINIRFNYGK